MIEALVGAAFFFVSFWAVVYFFAESWLVRERLLVEPPLRLREITTLAFCDPHARQDAVVASVRRRKREDFLIALLGYGLLLFPYGLMIVEILD